jgi:group II intron reverse transcriptase/maturase
MGETSSSQTVSTRLRRIAEQAIRYPEMVFTTLAHHIDVDFLREAYRLTRKDAAPGIDQVTAKEYTLNLEENLRNLHSRLKGGRYYTPPVNRVWIPKDEGGKRPLGLPTFEDKIVQRAVTMLLEAVYEGEFYDFSHGFRRGHSQHQALSELRQRCMEGNIGWIVDADVKGCFDNIDHGRLLEVIRQRVNDGGILRLIGKWLKAGVMEGETLTYPEKGTQQGGVASPMLANIFLHHVLDEWYAREAKPRIKGQSFLIRFADDFLVGCEHETDAQWVMTALTERLQQYGLTLHPTKTRLVKFGRPREKSTRENGSFDFLGFTHYWATSRRGYWVIKRETARKRLRRTFKRIWEWCRKTRHEPLREQHRALCLKLKGHYQYYGIRCNYRKLSLVYRQVWKAWKYWLSRRSNKGSISWEGLSKLEQLFPFPKPQIIHDI